MKPISVLQIVDSLTPGGTESVAVNLANGLSTATGFQSYLVCAREEAELKERLVPGVSYLWLNKKGMADFKSVWRLHRFIQKNKIDIVHAHSTSFYFPVLLKWLHRYKIVWHDHYGLQMPPDGSRSYPYIPFSRWFNYAISVNDYLLRSNQKHLHLKAGLQSYVPNYSVALPVQEMPVLKGTKELRLVCLANLRPQKDHFNLLKAFRQVKNKHAGAVLYCVGICKGDVYEQEVRQMVNELQLADGVVFTGSVANPFEYLQQCSVGILSSLSEGLPLSLIEYGLAGLPVVCTQVGQCAELLDDGKSGLLVPSENDELLAAAIEKLLGDAALQKRIAGTFAAFIRQHYSQQAILQRVVTIYQSLI